MNQFVKFRAWDEENKRMIPWSDTFFYDTSPVTNWSGSFEHIEMLLMQYVGLRDMNGVEICVGDILEVTYFSWRRYRVEVKLGRYKQDNSAGEYTGADCIGFYAEVIDKEAKDEDGDTIVRDYMHTSSLLEYEDLEVVGNIYEKENDKNGTKRI